MIAINYRRDDSGGYALCLYYALKKRNFDVFIDVEGRLAGKGDYTKRIFEEIDKRHVLICLIGPDWITTSDSNGRRLDNPDDLVRREIDYALQRDKIVVPVRLNNTRMPSSSELPQSISDITRMDSPIMRHERFDVDVEELCGVIRAALNARLGSNKFSSNSKNLWTPVALDNLEKLTTHLAASGRATDASNMPVARNSLLDYSTAPPRNSLWDLLSKKDPKVDYPE